MSARTPIDTRRVMAALLSPSALFWLFAAWVLWYVTWSVWSKEAFASFVGMLKTNALFQVLYIFGLANASYNTARMLNDIRKQSVYKAVLWAILPVGGVLFSLGFLMAASMRDEGKQYLGIGGELNPPWERETFVISGIDLALKDEVSDIEYSADPGLLFVNEPRMTVDVPQSPAGVVRIGAYPPVRLGSTYYHILSYGLAPGLRLIDQSGAVIDEAFVISNILPPGNLHSFEFGGGRYRMSIAIEPVRVIEKGDAKTRVYNLKTPLYKLTVVRGDDIVFEGTAKESAAFSDGSRLEIVPPEPWVWVEASTGEGYWLLALGLALITLGIPVSIGLAIARLVSASRAGQ